MKLSSLPARVAWPIAILAALGTFAGLYLGLGLALWASGLVAILVFVALYLIFDPRSDKEVLGDQYEAAAKARVRQALDQLRGIEQIRRKLPQGPVNQEVQNVSRLAQILLAEVEEKRPNELMSAASAVEYRVTKLHEALDMYVDILQDPRKQQQPRYAEISQRITTKTLPAVEQWLGNNIDRLNAGDMLQLEVNLDQLEASQYESLK
jgi:hypothetical protein